MARTPSNMLPLGTPAPSFRLPDTEGWPAPPPGAAVPLEVPSAVRWVGLEDFREARGLVVLFLCNHCPFVLHIQAGLTAFAEDYLPRGLAIVAISSNDVERYPEDAPWAMAEEKAQAGYPFPYLFDADQSVAMAYQAACTPDLYLFDGDRKLVYRGQFDGSRPGNDIPVTGSDLRQATEALLAGTPIPDLQHPSIGCNIKWRPGSEP
jgi:hypothetical protein